MTTQYSKTAVNQYGTLECTTSQISGKRIPRHWPCNFYFHTMRSDNVLSNLCKANAVHIGSETEINARIYRVVRVFHAAKDDLELSTSSFENHTV
jgi:hypothetical protein